MKETLDIPAAYDGQVWHYQHRGAHRVMHRHDELELNVIVQGTASYLFADRKYQLREGMQVWLFAGQDHVLLEESPHYAMWIVVFRPELVRRICTEPITALLHVDNPPGQFCRQLPATSFARLAGLLGELFHIRDHPARFNNGLAYTLLSAWEFHALAAETVGSAVHPAVEHAARLLQDEGDCDTASLAQQIGLSVSHLSRLFRQHTGVSLLAFRSQQRIKRFMRLYDRGQHMTMHTAALEAGFGSYAQFYRAFNQHMHCSPSAYQRLARAKSTV